MHLQWRLTSFNDLSADELYRIIRLRNEVFVVEQTCVYQDADDKDQMSKHLSGWQNDELVAYCRILPPGVSFDEASIGRVVTSPLYRKAGIGRALMQLAIEKTIEQFTCKKITISAQLYLKAFYESLGFEVIGVPYPEDGIPHIRMLYTL